MIRTQVGLWLTDAGLFHLVLGNYSKIMPDVLLEGSVASLYGDYRDINRPKAVLEIQFFPDRRYQAQIPGPAPKTITQGNTGHDHVPGRTWSTAGTRALRQVLTDFEEALRQTDLKGLTAKSGGGRLIHILRSINVN